MPHSAKERRFCCTCPVTRCELKCKRRCRCSFRCGADAPEGSVRNRELWGTIFPLSKAHKIWIANQKASRLVHAALHLNVTAREQSKAVVCSSLLAGVIRAVTNAKKEAHTWCGRTGTWRSNSREMTKKRKRGKRRKYDVTANELLISIARL